MAPNFGDATSFYRAAWPLSRLHKEKKIEVNFHPSGGDQVMTWADMVCYDVLFLQRPHTDWNFDIMRIARSVV